MSFRFYTNAISQASRNIVAGIFTLGLVLIGIGFLIWILRDIFAILFSILFMAVGVGCGVTAFKMYWAIRRMEKADSCRTNVRIHIED